MKRGYRQKILALRQVPGIVLRSLQDNYAQTHMLCGNKVDESICVESNGHAYTLPGVSFGERNFVI